MNQNVNGGICIRVRYYSPTNTLPSRFSARVVRPDGVVWTWPVPEGAAFYSDIAESVAAELVKRLGPLYSVERIMYGDPDHRARDLYVIVQVHRMPE